jgi:hypothetical protein
MPRNPLYDPGWAVRLQAIETRLAQLRRRETAEATASFASPAHHAALGWLDAAKQERRTAFLGQFETIADYAMWRLTGLEPSKDGFAMAWDPAGFTSISDVDDAYERTLQHRREGTLEENFRLSIGQPPGLAAFADKSSIISSWRRFGETDCMVSFCTAAENFNICLAHQWGQLTRQSNELFRSIATQLARESMVLMLPAATPVFERDGHRMAQNREAIRQVNALAAKFRFYRHLLPEHGLREEFCQVTMGWDGARFIDPEWSAIVYGTLPLALREAAGQPSLLALR